MIHSDDKGLVLPPLVAKTQVVVIPIYTKDNRAAVLRKAGIICDQLRSAKIRCDLDSREIYNPGWKFNNHELKGVPLRVEIGRHDMENNRVTLKRRDSEQKVEVKMPYIVTTVQDTLKDIQENLYRRAEQQLKTHTIHCTTFADTLKALDDHNIVLVPFCDTSSCEDSIKERTKEASNLGAKTLCKPFDQPALTDKHKCIGCGNKALTWCLFGRSF